MANNFKLIIGIGNYDKKYSNTYHNLGFYFIDQLANQFTSEPKWKENQYFEFLKIENFILAKTKTYMNEAGIGVKKAKDFFSLQSQEIVIIHDDSDLLLGKIKLSFDKNSGGHKGIESIISHLKTSEFWRLRIGIRPLSETNRAKAEDLVLKKISQKDFKVFQSLVGPLKEKLKLNVNPVGET